MNTYIFPSDTRVLVVMAETIEVAVSILQPTQLEINKVVVLSDSNTTVEISWTDKKAHMVKRTGPQEQIRVLWDHLKSDNED